LTAINLRISIELKIVNAYTGGAMTAAARTRPRADPVPDLSAFGIGRDEVRVGHVRLMPSERQLFLNETRAHVSAREFDVLLARVVCAGHVVSRERIYEHVWGRPMPHARDRVVDTHLRRIRLRLAQISPGWTYIHTHFSHGYRFDPERAKRRRALRPP
jgi:DNA-binding response OmpR family regulator